MAMSDPNLEFMKSIKQDLRDLTAQVTIMNTKMDERLDELEDSHSQMRGAAKLGAAIVTMVSGAISFTVTYFKG